MKRILALLLVLLLLFCTFGCKEEPPENTEQPPKREWGEFYRKDGYVHNTMISAVLNTNELTAPVTELSYTLYDNTDFGVSVTYYTETNDHRAHRLLGAVTGEVKHRVSLLGQPVIDFVLGGLVGNKIDVVDVFL